MALIRHIPANQFVEISDNTIGATTIKRKAEILNLTYSISDLYVLIYVRIIPFAKNDDGSYGDDLTLVKGFQPYFKNIIANMQQLVNATTGDVVGSVLLLNDLANEAEGGPLFGIDYMYEFEYYKLIAETQPVIIDNLVIGKVQEADAQGKL